MIGFDYSPCDFCPKDCDGADLNCEIYRKNAELLKAIAGGDQDD